MEQAARLLAGAFAATGLLALLPAIVGARASGAGGLAFLATAAFCIFLAGALRFTTAGIPGRLPRAHGIIALSLVWVLVPLAATPAIATVGKLTPLAAFFEAVSAFTCTGLTSLEKGPQSLYVWLGLLQWAGGLFTVVSALTVLAPAGIGGLPDRVAPSGSTLDAMELSGVTREIVPIYAGVTALLLLILMIDGQTLYVAFTLATAAVSAGAHLPPEAQIALTLDAGTKWLVLPFLLWAATSVRWHRALLTRRFRSAPEQAESLTLLAWWAVLGVAFGSLIYQAGDLEWREAVRDGLFSAASLISTSGIGAPEGSYAVLPLALVFATAALGGGVLSMAGGLKIKRLRAMVLRLRADLSRLISPNLVQRSVLREEQGEAGTGPGMRGVWIAAATLFVVLGLMVVALAPGLPDLGAAVAAATAVVTNTGPVYDAAGKGWPVITSLPAGSVLAAMAGMIAGRLEIIGFFVVFHLAVWRT